MVEKKSDARKLRSLGRRREIKHGQGQILGVKEDPGSEKYHCKHPVSRYPRHMEGGKKL